MSERQRVQLLLALLFGLALALLGPKLTRPEEVRAGEPFAYEPPPGFVENVGQAAPVIDMTGKAPKLTPPKSGEREWFHAPTGASVTPNIHLSHSQSRGTVEPEDLARIAEGMPSMLAADGVTWRTLRTETRVRPDGSRVGLIEGECTKARLAGGILPSGDEAHYRRLMLAFPDDQGMAIVVAVYDDKDAPGLEGAVEATIASARGVATRLSKPSLFVRLAWGAAGFVVCAFVLALTSRARAKRSVTS